ncbi:unnamed protein product [Pedinophyceae sp. YPF-701]|nr:unnamed protein product [Pedinophyceae sp. YPF-701]
MMALTAKAQCGAQCAGLTGRSRPLQTGWGGRALRQAVRSSRRRVVASAEDEASAEMDMEQGEAELSAREASRQPPAEMGHDSPVEEIDRAFGNDMVQFVQDDETGAIFAALQHPRGGVAFVSVAGAAVTAWVTSNGHEALFAPKKEQIELEKPFRGGITPCFPQVMKENVSIPDGGFASQLDWRVRAVELSPEGAQDPAPTVVLVARDDENSRKMFPGRFEVEARVSLMEDDDPPPRQPWNTVRPWKNRGAVPWLPQENDGPGAKAAAASSSKTVVSPSDMVAETVPEQVLYALRVTNTGTEPLSFTAGVRAHLRVHDTASEFVRALGLGGLWYIDYADPSDPQMFIDGEDYTHFDERVSRVYVEADDSGDIWLCPGDQTHWQVYNRGGFRDMHVFNPGAGAPDTAKQHVRLGPGTFARRITLQPGESWSGETAMRYLGEYWEIPEWDREGDVPPPPMTRENVANFS